MKIRIKLQAAIAKRHSRAFWLLCMLLGIVFMIGGGSRSDIASLVVLRPVSALFLGFGVLGLTRAHINRYRFLFGLALLVVASVAVQLVPLPPSIWAALPGRELVVSIDQAAGAEAVWRPISLVPSGTWNALFSLMAPLATLLLASQLHGEDRAGLMPIILAIGMASSILAMLQLLGGVGSSLYFYQVTNRGGAVGLFANRNHQAMFLASLFPILAAYASDHARSATDVRLRRVIALFIGIFILPLILVTGSRAGIVLTILGLISTPFLYHFPKRHGDRAGRWRRFMPWAALVIIICGLVALTIFFGRAVAIDRATAEMADEGRFKAWPTISAMTWQYFPVGSGFGSFAEIFKVHEPQDILSVTYFNHAHNDWLESMLTGGGIAVVLIMIAVTYFLVSAVRLIRFRHRRDENYVLALAGAWMILLFALASLADYPLRVPALSCLLCLAAVWTASLKPVRALR